MFKTSERKISVFCMPGLLAVLAFCLITGGVAAQEKDIEARIAEIKQQIETIKGDNGRLRSQIEEKETRIQEMRREIEELDRKLKEMKTSAGS